jgi:hypothetical protein
MPIRVKLGHRSVVYHSDLVAGAQVRHILVLIQGVASIVEAHHDLVRVLEPRLHLWAARGSDKSIVLSLKSAPARGRITS